MNEANYHKGYQDAINECINLTAYNFNPDYTYGYEDAMYDMNHPSITEYQVVSGFDV